MATLEEQIEVVKRQLRFCAEQEVQEWWLDFNLPDLHRELHTLYRILGEEDSLVDR